MKRLGDSMPSFEHTLTLTTIDKSSRISNEQNNAHAFELNHRVNSSKNNH